MGPRLAGAGAVLAVALVALFVVDRPLVGFGAGSSSDGGEVTFEEREIAIGVRCLRVQVAETPEQKHQGLRGRDSLGEFDGMLFPYESSSDQRAFTMSGVRFALTIGFYDDAGTRVDAVDMEPCPDDEASCPLYRSRAPFRTALEVAKGALPEGSYVPTCPA
jgi:uncharacterized membrane protein (UPF0127 family)